MTKKMTMILAGAGLVLAGCGGGGGNGGGGGIAGPADLPVPLGLEFGVPVSVLSADQRPGESVFVGNDLATLTLNDLTLDGDGNVLTFSLTLGLPNGGSVTLDETNDVIFDDFVEQIADVGFGTARLETADGDVVDIIVGFGFDPEVDSTAEAAFAGNGLFVMAIVDELEEEPVFGFNTYLVAGAETETLPTGIAIYEGFAVASVYADGALVEEEIFGDVFVGADFDLNTVDLFLGGGGFAAGYELGGEDLDIVDSQYSGAIAGNVFIIDGPEAFVEGEVFGAFYGADAEATAGVFVADGFDAEVELEIVGGFGAAAVFFDP